MTTTVCVIGGSGFVGSHVVNAALQKGWKVRVAMRNPNDESKTACLSALPNAKGNIEFFAGELDKKGSYSEAIKGSDAVVVAAFPEEPKALELIETVRGGAEHILASCTEHGVKTIVLTSSGGSTNPKEGEPPVKNEIDHWSDPDFQISQGKYSPAAKTLMDKTALKYGEDHPELRVVIFNPNGIVGPVYQSELTLSMKMMLRLIKGEMMPKIPNGSMSFIHVDDLAALEIAAIENPEAKGRYFGVLASFHWADILGTLAEIQPSYKVPPKAYDGEDVRPTQFDNTRRDSLGVKLRGIKEIMTDAVEEYKKRGLL